MTAVANLLTPAAREALQALEERLAELRDLDRELRRPGSLASPPTPPPLHRAGRQQDQDDTDRPPP